MLDTPPSSLKSGEHATANVAARFAKKKANDDAAAAQLLEKER
jgi:hypothetical protein